nr:reverse transcriptase domain-containing protein [Tanacetum cinerariifolium]
MTHLLEKNTPFVFSEDCIQAFQTLKKKLTEAPILIAPNWDLPFELMCDASDFAIGAVLGQRHEKHIKPIHYPSKTMNDAETNYTTTEKEMLAVVVPHYTKDCPLKEKGKTLEEAYYTQFGVPLSQAGRYRVAAPGFYQRDNGNTSYDVHRAYSSDCSFLKENGYDEKEVMKELKKLQVNSTESTTSLRRLLKENSRIKEEIKETIKVHCSTIINDALPLKEKDIGSFTLPCGINNMCFDIALADIGSSVSVMPYSTFTNLGLRKLAPTKLIIELADKIVKRHKGIAKNVLVRIEKNEYKGENVVGVFMNVPIFVGNFSIFTDFSLVENMDAYRDKNMCDVIIGKPFCRVACVEAK